MGSENVLHSPASATEDAPLDWFRNAHPRLREDVELLEGLDGKPLLYIGATGRYLAIGRDVVPLLPLFDGVTTGAELVERLRGDRDPEQVATRVSWLAHSLRQAGALEEPPARVGVRRGLARFMRREHLLRLPLTRRVGLVLEPVVAPLRAIPGPRLAALWITLAAVGAVLGVVALATAGANWRLPAHAWLLYPLIFAQIAAHELSHALVCQYLRVPVREAGIGLMLYVMPVGYVDRTDAYRVADRRSRAFLSSAGPVNDQLWFGAAAVVAMTVPGEPGDLAFMLLIFQAFLTVMNLNPVTPSDGYQVVSAFAGEVNVRGQALSYLTHRLLRIPLPPGVAALTPRRRRFYLGYAVACLLFLALLVAGVLRTLLGLVEVLS
ncbi:M50 family metallopeptidase [Rathayibacter rathayi]|uniref:Cyclic nucleotide-binding protein n=1 Tax=Rathayibacter rathayi TaxID=33887 RepID=A0ABD6WC56_RATRA|nr:M50 family metallopeptidase [Rathayibacter rathayi]PPF15586.1 cyclic nucleotide-binding protein [Rathayibacter rathayi]PPF80355.1 cyclic nucleotide-binding protein [Rathayibacter rathayi]PPG12459.1 cyclic nucleotide-binding protein [Rathayibacter rathayi]PPG89071.1 cyclic nucleotide-binding protein [Rathayibacter rathayi]PPI02934.1 cyclic nucleotide-binding protein [Rathayibacter rathayi]